MPHTWTPAPLYPCTPAPSHLYRLRDRRPTDLPNPIPAGCDREEKRRYREVRGVWRELGSKREELEERLEPEEAWRERVAREGGRRSSQRVESRLRQNDPPKKKHI